MIRVIGDPGDATEYSVGDRGAKFDQDGQEKTDGTIEIQ